MTVENPGNEDRLIDRAVGELSAAETRLLDERLAAEGPLRKRREDIANALSAMRLVRQVDPPADLVENTLRRIRQERTREALIAREQLRGSPLRPMFSLRELVAIAAAVIVVAAVFVPSVRKARQLAAAGCCASGMGQIGSALAYYANANRGYLPAACVERRRWLPAEDEPAVSNSAGLFKLVQQGYASPVLFQCPAVGGKSFELRAFMKDFPAATFVHYSYQHTVGHGGLSCDDPELAGVHGGMAILADGSPVFVDGRFQRDQVGSASENHRRTGQNVLYLDMHVSWASKPAVGLSGDDIYLAAGVDEYTGEENPTSSTDSFLLPAFSVGSYPGR